jgi:hypothetical protein
MMKEATLPSLLRRIAECNRLEQFKFDTAEDTLTRAKLGSTLQDSFRYLVRSRTLFGLRLEGAILEQFPLHILAAVPTLAHLAIF